MARIKVGVTAHRRHKHILKLAKGYRGSKSKLFKKANETVMKRCTTLAVTEEPRNANSVSSGLPVSMLQPVLMA